MSRPEFTCTASVAYLPGQSQPSAGTYAFAYTITIVNSGDIAAQLGMSPETLSRQMRQLIRLGLIEVRGYQVRVLDSAALARLAQA